MASAMYGSNVFLIASLVLFSVVLGLGGRSFTIDGKNGTFLRDGKPFRYIAGSIDYQRVPYQYWEDRIRKLWAGGFNAVQLYVPWNLHEPSPGVYDFSGQQDLVCLLKLAMDYDLIVLLRPGPYICDEWEYGGLPAWLLTIDPNMLVRTMDKNYIAAVDQYFTVLHKVIKPYLYVNGGPIVVVQIENEYGMFYACDHDYLKWLTEKTRAELGNEIILTTIDPPNINFFKCGTLKELYLTLDFGMTANPASKFALQKAWETGPLVDNELYTGWFDHWGEKHNTIKASDVANFIDELLGLGANIDLDMFEGGTSFGFMNGAHSPPYIPVLTSYDYDSPLSEAGDIREKYMDIRKVIAKYKDVPPIPMIPPDTPKMAYGKVQLKMVSTVSSYMELLQPIVSIYPLTMEQIQHYYGFLLYRYTFTEDISSKPLDLSAVRDRAYVSVNQVPVAVVQRQKNTTVMLTVKKGQKLDILVENQGRIGYGFDINNNTKGLISNVTLDGQVLVDWKIWPVVLPPHVNVTDDIRSDLKVGTPAGLTSPALFRGNFTIKDAPVDTYLDMINWTKGQAFINGFNLGRYWPSRGPQMRLYVPKFVLKQGDNVMEMLELEKSPCKSSGDCWVDFKDQEWLNGTVHPDGHSEIHWKFQTHNLKFMPTY